MAISLEKKDKKNILIVALILTALGGVIYKYKHKLAPKATEQTSQSANVSNKEIMRYLDENPEVVTQWMIKHAKLMSKTLKEIEALNSDKKYQELQQYIYLGENYDISKPIIFEFYNFGCSVCKDALRVLKTLPEAKGYNVALLHIHSENHAYASLLAQIVESLAVLDKAKVIPFIEMAFEYQTQFETEDFNLVLNEIWAKMDIDEMESKKIWDTIKEQRLYDKLVVYRTLADQSEIQSTPSFVVRGNVYKGLPPTEIFKNILNHK